LAASSVFLSQLLTFQPQLPDYPAPVRNGAKGRELVMARWGMPSSQRADGGTTYIHNVNSAHWKRWLVSDHRCLIPFTFFSEYDKIDGKKVSVWFAPDESRPPALRCSGRFRTNR
jgi:putative SOS response-associated peptidase YedK